MMFNYRFKNHAHPPVVAGTRLVRVVLPQPKNLKTEQCSIVVVTCSYYNTGNYATIEDRTTDDKQINYYKDRYNSSAVFLCGAEDVWCGNQEIVGVGNRHDNIDPSFYYCVCTN